MNTVFRFPMMLISTIVSLSMLCSCGSISTSDKEGHVVRPLFSSSLWNAIRSWDILPSTNSTLALWGFVLIGICSVIFLYKKLNCIFPAVAVAVIGMCQIYFFLGYTGRLDEVCGSYLLTLLLVIALTTQVLVTDKIAIDHNLTGDYYARKDTGIIGIIWSLSVIIVSLLYYIFTDFLGWSIMGWILKLFELWLLALIVNLTYGAVTDRFDTKESDSKVYYISAGVISFMGFLITISYNTFAGYIASVIAIIYLVPKYLGSHKADTRIREAADAEEFEKIQKGVESGDSWAICRLGERYWSGKGVDKDYNKAFELFSRAVELGNKVAFWDLARCYDHGWGAPFNPQKAVELYNEAYNRGVIQACYPLGRLYDKEEYGLCNSVESFNWFLKGAEGGDADCQFRVANCYEKGIGTAKDINIAMKWFKQAADNDEKYSACHYGQYMYEHGYQQEGLQYLRKAKNQGYELAKEYMDHYHLN